MASHRSAFKELNQMPAKLKEDVECWHHLITNGNQQLTSYAKTYGLICMHQNELYCGDRKTTRRTQESIDHLSVRLNKNIFVLKHILEALRLTRDRIEYMWQRVRIWNDDEHLKNYPITQKLNTSKLHNLLLFLHKRYEYEWEVKEMVVLGLDDDNVEYDVEILLAAWKTNRHAGGFEFNAKLKEFYSSIGQRPPKFLK
ncbi:uncharacterized protein LOC132792787 [Drosophila nasuta]|uniref:uncharacterized protein LOC132792787 n=1 Tax=Drosophila nasuta TaxID=42062 RepID=UPI00295E5F08|nr:uncharacterized protein LOC132792787 [Drosophila nasuta]